MKDDYSSQVTQRIARGRMATYCDTHSSPYWAMAGGAAS